LPGTRGHLHSGAPDFAHPAHPIAAPLDLTQLTARSVSRLDLTQLTALHLWSNHVRVIPSNFFVASAELRELSMWGNRLQAVHNRTFLGLPRLRLLDLDRNRISTPQRGSSDADTRWQYRSKLSSSSSSSVANASSARTVASLSSDRDQ